MAGEILTWMDGHDGVIEFFNTARRWRNMGVGSCMVALGSSYLAEQGARNIRVDVRAKMQIVRRTLAKAGFEQYELLSRYPGIDV